MALLLALAASSLASAEPTEVPFDSPRWKILGEDWRIEEHLGRQSLLLPGGMALLEDVEMLDGVVEFDISFTADRGFAGVMFRLQDRGNYEHFYVRPHQSGKPDASQYTPVFDGVSAWQLYHGEGYGTAIDYPNDQWIPVRIVFSGGQAEVSVDSDQPLLFVDELKHDPRAGAIGVNNNGAKAHFSNFRYELLESPKLSDPGREPRSAPEGAIMRWSVSSRFDEARLKGAAELPDDLADELEWQMLEAESSGIVNLARLGGIGDGANTKMGRIRLRSDRRVSVPVRFGYSDRVRVFLDGRVLYQGENVYESRDYRYLGTIGLFDQVWLHLEPGEHELDFAVSESFGGWGLIATIDASARSGVEILP